LPDTDSQLRDTPPDFRDTQKVSPDSPKVSAITPPDLPDCQKVSPDSPKVSAITPPEFGDTQKGFACHSDIQDLTRGAFESTLGPSPCARGAQLLFEPAPFRNADSFGRHRSERQELGLQLINLSIGPRNTVHRAKKFEARCRKSKAIPLFCL
jgi:hypothetical protein